MSLSSRSLSNAPCIWGYAGGFACSNVDLLSFVPLHEIDAERANDIWGWTDPTNDREYAILGLRSGTAFLDVTAPTHPVHLGTLPPHTDDSIWRDIKTYGDHAFIVSEAAGSGMQIFDLTQFRDLVDLYQEDLYNNNIYDDDDDDDDDDDHPTAATSLSPSSLPPSSSPSQRSLPIAFTETAYYEGFSNARNLFINQDSGRAYVVGSNTCDGGPHIVDVSTPTSPVTLGCYGDQGESHDIQCVTYNGPDTDHVGKEICVACNVDSIDIYDVSNPADPILLSELMEEDFKQPHQGWLTEDLRYFMVGDDWDEMRMGVFTTTFILDVSDLDAPFVAGRHVHDTAAVDNNQHVLGKYSYQANYQVGLRIMELTDLANAELTEVGYFDVYEDGDGPGFNGAYSTYPYLKSGVVLVSGIEKGLFVLRYTADACQQCIDVTTNDLPAVEKDALVSMTDHQKFRQCRKDCSKLVDSTDVYQSIRSTCGKLCKLMYKGDPPPSPETAPVTACVQAGICPHSGS